MRKVILYIAMSLDGYIADKNGGVSWLNGQDVNDQEMNSYSEFIRGIDTVIMGWKTYHQITTELSPDEWAYKGMKSYVITHNRFQSTEEIECYNEDMYSLLRTLKNQEGKNIWICGGANIVNQLIKSNLIDRYHITIIPTILGSGIPLFEVSNPEIPLKLISTKSYNGMTDLVYEKKL